MRAPRLSLALLALALCALATARDLSPRDGTVRGAAWADTILQVPPNLQRNLVAHWPLVGGTGASATETSGADWTATLSGAPTWGATWLAFNGTAAQYGTVSGPNLAGATSVSASLWIYRSTATLGVLVSISTGTENVGRWQIYVQADGKPVIYWRHSAIDAGVGSANIGISTLACARSIWCHVATDINTETGVAHVWVDNALGLTYTGTAGALGASTPLRRRIAQNITPTPSAGFAGRIADIWIFQDRILTAAERAAVRAAWAPSE